MVEWQQSNSMDAILASKHQINIMLLNRYAWLTRKTTCKIPLSGHILTLEAYFTSNACESARPTLANPPAQRMYPFPLDRCIRPMSLPARRIHSLVFVRGDARRSFRPPMAWSVFFLTALPVSNEEQRASESRIRRCSISYPISLFRSLASYAAAPIMNA